MAKFIQLARCYYSDKDIEDILSNARFSQKALLQIARERGMFLSADEKREDVIRYLSRQHFDWNSLNNLTSKLNRDESEERRATVRLENVSSLDPIEKAAEKTKEKLSKDRQVITVTKSNGRLLINGTYVEIDPTRSKAVQREEKRFLVEFELDKGTVKAAYTHSGKAGALIAEVLKELQGEKNTEGVALKRISLSGIKDPVLRTDYLLKIRSGLAGFRALDVLDINLDHRFETDAEPEDSDEDEKADEGEKKEETSEEAEVKSMVKSAAIHGSGLLTSDLYQRLREKGYYIYKLLWSAKELNGEGRVMEFEVGFDVPIKADGFFYDVKRILPTDADKEAGKTQHELLVAERPRVRRTIAEAAFKSLEEIEKLSATNNASTK